MAFAFQATVVIAAASGANQTNITVCLTGTNTVLRTLANGGAVRNTVTRVGQTVPADLILSSDMAGLNLYTWGWDFYDPLNGIATMWVLVPLLSSASSTTIFVSVGDATVTTYQGGAQGAEFDANTRACWHMPDGATLSLKDFSANSLDGNNTKGITAGTGQVDGASIWTGIQWSVIPTTSIATNLTIETWVKNPNFATNQFILSKEPVNGNWALFVEGGLLKMRDAGGVDLTIAAPSLNVWHHIAAVWAGTNATLYIDGVQVATRVGVAIANGASNLLMGAFAQALGSYNYSGSLDEMTLSATNRGANWIATRYANQSSIPVMSAFASLVTARSGLLTLMGVQ